MFFGRGVCEVAGERLSIEARVERSQRLLKQVLEIRLQVGIQQQDG